MNRKERRAQKQMDWELKQVVGNLDITPEAVCIIQHFIDAFLRMAQYRADFTTYRGLDGGWKKIDPTVLHELRVTIERVAVHLRKLQKEGKLPKERKELIKV